MPKLADNNTSATSKNVTPLPLQLPLNTFNTPIHCSIERFAATTQINSTIYHSFWSYQPLVAPQNMSPTRLGNTPVWAFKYSMRVVNMIFMTFMEYLTFQTEALYSFWYLKTPKKIWIKTFQKYSPREFWIMKVVTGLFSFFRSCQPWIFCSEYLQK